MNWYPIAQPCRATAEIRITGMTLAAFRIIHFLLFRKRIRVSTQSPGYLAGRYPSPTSRR
ncbi:protein of unknown function [Methylococcus capsulatus]|uniref:Uncharacterized protein n=1 Tax=Methylococcus capsulatus TaxID=414 RepID=A0AA35UGE2_METCP|nr:protein of unknown function [Methylococcus capsulatus]